METLLVIGLVIGVWVGFLIGRMWAERGRASFEARGAWLVRKRYRGTRPF